MELRRGVRKEQNGCMSKVMFSFKVYRLEENLVVGNVSKFGPSVKKGLHSSDTVYRIQYPEVFTKILCIEIFIAKIR